MARRIGVISIQGDFEKHLDAVRRAAAEAGIGDIEATEVRTPEELAKVERAIVPGGESSAVGMLMERYGLAGALREAAAEGMPIWGTCMGMIVMAKEIEGSEQPRLGILDIAVRRNAFGAQVHSFEDEIGVNGLDSPVTGVFIRAPVVVRCGAGVEPLAVYGGQIVAVRQGNLLGTSFHPELTDDTRLHAWFLRL